MTEETEIGWKGDEAMSVGGINAAGSMSGGQMAKSQPADAASKSIQNKISAVQQKMQQLSSKEDLSAEEKMKKRQELQQELSSLNTQLRQHRADASRKKHQTEASDNQRQAEAGRERQKEVLAKEAEADRKRAEAARAEVMQTEKAQAEKMQPEKAQPEDRQKEAAQADTVQTDTVRPEEAQADSGQADRSGKKEIENIDTGFSHREVRAMAVAETSMERAKRQGTVVARIEGGVAILRGEISQDEARGMNVERKEAELAGQEEKVWDTTASQSSVLSEARQAMREAALNQTETQAAEPARVGIKPKHEVEDRDMIGATNYRKEAEQAVRQPFIISGVETF